MSGRGLLLEFGVIANKTKGDGYEKTGVFSLTFTVCRFVF